MPEEAPEVSELVVIAKRITDRGSQLGPSFPLADIQHPGDISSVGGENSPELNPCDYAESKLEKQTDAKANAAAATIKNQNWQTQEYGAFVYRDANGVVRLGVLTGGSAVQWTPSAENMAGIASYAQVIGFIHNHPENSTTPVEGMYPSAVRDENGGLVGGDWFTFNYVQSQIQTAGGDSTQLRQYVIGPDGVLRYFDSSHRDSGALGPEIDPNESGCP